MKIIKISILVTLLNFSYLNFINAQYVSVDLLNSNDTLWFKTSNPAVEELLNSVKFNFSKGNDKYDVAQVIMKVHNIDPFKLPQILLNNKPVNVGVYLPNLDQNAVFNYTMQDTIVLNFGTPFGQDAAEINFIFNPKDLINGENIIRFKPQGSSFSVTNIKLALRGKSKNDIFQYPAEFIGGTKAWMRYLKIYLDSDVPVKNGAPAGTYSVIVTFIILPDGSISDVTAENDPGYGTKEEAIKILQNSPKWKPAIINGTTVSYKHRQQIVFGVRDLENNQ
jgi:hypothetical protein